jgi:low temperature requirement protein LtrA
MSRAGGGDHLLRRRGGGDADAHRPAPIELFFDLVFVFAFTQISHLLLEHLDARGVAETAVLLAAVWWGWLTTTWLTSWFDPRHMLIALLLIGTMLVSLVMSMAIPEAFGDQALTFAIAYVVIQLGRSVILLAALGRGHPLKVTFRRVLAWASVGAVCWIAGALAGGYAQLVLWALAVLVDNLPPFFGFRFPGLGRSSSREWAIEGAHFAERCQLLVIVALGESILVIGMATVAAELTFATGLAFVLAFLTSVGLWWLYFGNVADVGAMALAAADDPGRDALRFDHHHLVMIAGIIATAVGDELVISHPGAPADWPEALTLVGGPMIYLVGNGLLLRSLIGRVPVLRLAALGALAVLVLLTPLGPPSLLLSAASAAVLVATAIGEAAVVRRARRSPA